MCGIAGTIGIAEQTLIDTMTDALSHRGPDDRGTMVLPEISLALGHRRLAIIDLTEAGRQPMAYGDGRYSITYNGEIYNYRELRTELESKGHSFRTQTDTEVLLATYAEWGVKCLSRLRGMFAFAIADLTDRTVFLARDRFGVKPLVYSEQPGSFLFASELKALLASELVERRIEPQAVWDYLSLGSVPAPQTMLADARALEPGCAMLVDEGGRVTRRWRYWNIASASLERQSETQNLSFDEAAEALLAHLREAVQYHMIADVPVGAFLSGGVDSAAMVGLMSEQVSTPLRTFTVGFEQQHDALSETQAAAETARHFGTEHNEVVITDRQAADSFDALLDAWDQPSMDGANTFFVSAATSRHVKVALTGLGGDELFAGYPHFRRHALASRLASPLLAPLRALPDRFRHNLALPALDEAERLATLRCLMYEREKSRTVSPTFFAEFAPAPLKRLLHGEDADLDPIDRLSVVELEGYMARTLLRDGDVMSMAHGLETRPILLDHPLAEFALALPSSFKLRGGQGKAIFHAALSGVLPEFIAKRPKRGFELPLLRWLAGPLRERADQAFCSKSAHTVFTARFREDARRRIRHPKPRDFRLWAYFVLLEWMERQEVSL
ncbi:MAG: asparagine synthase (glutamine-hydrolyzing) [Lentisphaeria bacterium]|nr:asparagine synthase (glutamine-hydrolyzing) [Lentisphaeria bacterium]